jgi:peptidoglycan/xylan/chitin deacetylase (PgdA/CDA1 family)
MNESWQLVAELAAGVGVALGGAYLGVRSLLRPLRALGVPVLRYRLIGPPIPGSMLNELRIPSSKFEAQIRHLSRRGFWAVSLEEALARRGEREFLDQNPIALTFDGPYATFALVVWPILQRHGMNRVTLFFPPQSVGKDMIRLPEGRPERILDLETLLRLCREGVSVGLQAVPRGDADPYQLATDFTAGRRALSQLTRQPVDLLGLPFAHPAAIAAAKRVGFKGAAVLGDGVLTHRTPRFEIPRFSVQPDTELVQVALVVSRRTGINDW